MRREWIEIRKRRNCVKNIGSPSMRREWIEMKSCEVLQMDRKVSLHAEGVD